MISITNIIYRFIAWYDRRERSLLNSLRYHADAPYDQRVWRFGPLTLYLYDLERVGVKWARIAGITVRSKERELRDFAAVVERVLEQAITEPQFAAEFNKQLYYGFDHTLIVRPDPNRPLTGRSASVMVIDDLL